MRELVTQDLELCRLQGKLFEASPSLCACSSPVFIRRFMNSELARRFDDASILIQSATLQSMADELVAQYGTSEYGKKHYDAETLYWIGYIYRYWCIAFNSASKQVYKIVQAREMSLLYYPYHSLDPAQAIGRILEAKGTEPGEASPSDGYIKEGVALLRRMHQRPTYEYYSVRF